VTPDVLKKLALVGKDLATYSLETVAMFRNDASGAKYQLIQPMPSPLRSAAAH